jgi:glycine/D-amino acid oxidase-like deaminating enzyme
MAHVTSDLVIVGGGIMGLWAAVHAGKAGLSVRLLERETVGFAASGGLLGALMPHTPDRWNEKKQFQFDALVALEPEIRAMEAQTGLSAGYRRSGRLIPLAKPHLREIALRQVGDAAANWRHDGGCFDWRVLDAPPAGLFCADDVRHGAVLDTLAGRVSPRALLRLLLAVLADMPHVTISEHCGVRDIVPDQGQVTLDDGTALHAGHIVLSAGVESFPFLDRLAATPDAPPSGTAVKGQAARLAVDLDPALPILYSDGVYVIAHDAGGVAVGSTSEIRFSDAHSTDGKLDDLLEKAVRMVPALQGAPVIERWAGLRPKAVGRDPMAGPHPDHPRLHLLTGGFKISFGIAHRLAEAAISGIAGRPTVSLPPSFGCESHLAAQPASKAL